MDELISEKLKRLAKKECWFDDEECIINDWAGGNIDDAYQGGCVDGETALARELLKEFFPDMVE